MTKKDIIKTIQEAERKAWWDVMDCKAICGRDHEHTVKYMRVWHGIFEIMKSCKIESIRNQEEA